MRIAAAFQKVKVINMIADDEGEGSCHFWIFIRKFVLGDIKHGGDPKAMDGGDGG